MPENAIFLGDFNFKPTDPEYPKIVGPWSEQYGRVIPLAGFVDSWVASGHEQDEGITCDGMRIDYIYLSTALAPRIRKTWIDTEAAGSDHQPYYCEIDL